MTTWLDPQPVEVPDDLRHAVGGLDLVAKTLVRRGIRDPVTARGFLDPEYYTPAPPADLPGLARAAERLRQAAESGEPIAIWGDFDADGQTATALLLETLRAMGARVGFRVPTRQEGHGLHPRGLEELIAGGARLILTCDTGVTAHDAVIRANQLGAQVVITDHHVLGEELPPAVAVVNPHRLPSGHPLEALTGVGVAYQLARALDAGAAARSLDLVALGTVADVGALTADNRYLVQLGLDALRHTARPGLQAVYKAAELRPDGITEEHIGFVLGPRLNALGRLYDRTSKGEQQAGAAHGVELLTSTDATVARALASEVEGLNIRRQQLTRDVMAGALSQIARAPALLSDYHALVLSHEQWPGGIVGIVAGRLAERFHKPAVLISAPQKEGQLARGSGRSVPGVDLVAALAACAGLLKGYGGHPGAAGFSLDPERIPEFRAAFSRAVAAAAEVLPEPVLEIDAYVELSGLTLDLVEEISRLAPFGRGNPPLTLAVRDLRLISQATIGRTGEHLRLTVQDGHENTQTVFWWQGADQPLPGGMFDLALTVRASDYRGMAEIQVEWIDARLKETETVEVEAAPPFEVRDHREERNQEALLAGLVEEGDVQVWVEGLAASADVEARTRIELEPCPRLAVWTAPPGPREWQAALDHVQPDEVILFGRDPGLDERGAFLHDLSGLVSYALRRLQGEVDLERAAARLGHRAGTVAAGLEYLAASGKVSIHERGERLWRIGTGSQKPDPQQAMLTGPRLDSYLAETAAYRRGFRETPVDAMARHTGFQAQG
jgi:single-stranded-DNA-specific exonuclease